MNFALMFVLIVVSLSAQAKVVEKAVHYQSGSDKFTGFLMYDDALKGHHPGVLVVPDWMGVSEKAKDKAKQVAEVGYVAFLADIYGDGQQPSGPDQASKLATKYKSDRKLYREHLNLALVQLAHSPQVDDKRLGAIGFCFGGTGVIELARSGADVRGVVSFHGGLDSPEPAAGKNIKGKLLALAGADDPFQKPQDLAAFQDEMRTNHVDWQLVEYGGAVHSFTDKTAGTDNSKGAAYNERADRRSWLAMRDFFKEIF